MMVIQASPGGFDAPATFVTIALAGLLGWQLQASAAPRPASQQTDHTRAAEPGENTSSVDSGYRNASEQTGVDTNYRAG